MVWFGIYTEQSNRSTPKLYRIPHRYNMSLTFIFVVRSTEMFNIHSVCSLRYFQIFKKDPNNECIFKELLRGVPHKTRKRKEKRKEIPLNTLTTQWTGCLVCFEGKQSRIIVFSQSIDLPCALVLSINEHVINWYRL